MIEIVTIDDRPDLAPIVAEWIYHEWGMDDGYSLEETIKYISAASPRSPIPQTFVLLVDDKPVGTSSFVADDLKERPDLTPWLASVYVVPEERKKGYVIPLIQVVERAAMHALVRTLWLHTENAKHMYAKSGWREVEVVERAGRLPVTLMRRDFVPQSL